MCVKDGLLGKMENPERRNGDRMVNHGFCIEDQLVTASNSSKSTLSIGTFYGFVRQPK
jgi:hypothetical protein